MVTQILYIVAIILFISSTIRSDAEIEDVTDPLLYLQSAYWDPRIGRLIYVSTSGGRLISFNPLTKQVTPAALIGYPVFIVPTTDPESVIVGFLDLTIQKIMWDGISSKINGTEKLGTIEAPKNYIISAANVDPTGILFVGIGANGTDKGKGKLYKCDNGNFEEVPGYGTLTRPTTMVWDSTNSTLYLTDSLEKQILSYDYDIQNAKLSNRKVFRNTGDITPDLTPIAIEIDIDDNVWIAGANDAELCQAATDPPKDEALQKIKLPVKITTSLAWGDENYDVLYLVSARIVGDFKDDSDKAGTILAIKNLGTSGVPRRLADLSK